jgi:hypothetical protein
MFVDVGVGSGESVGCGAGVAQAERATVRKTRVKILGFELCILQNL